MPSMTEAAQVGKLQTIKNAVFNSESEKTPFLSKLKVGDTPNGMLCTWQDEILPAAISTGVLDGTPATTPTRVDRYLIEGCAQHFRQEWGVTTLANVTKVAGVKNEAARQMYKKMIMLKRSMEQQFLSNEDSAAENGGTPWTTRGVFKWLQNAAQTDHPVNVAIRPAAACMFTSAISGFTESEFRKMLEAAYDAVKAPVTLEGFVGITLKGMIDDWTNIFPTASTTNQPRTAYRVEGNNEYLNTVDMVKFSAGVASMILDPFVAVTTSTGVKSASTPLSGVFLDMDMWDLGYLQDPSNTNLPVDGSGKKGFVDAIVALRCLSPLGQCAVLTNS
jgi:hypothetical protein